MAVRFQIVILFYLVNVLTLFQVHGIYIQVYQHDNFTGLLWQSYSNAECTNVPSDKLGEIYSIKTDTCFVVYNGEDCKVPRSKKYMPGNIKISEDELERAGWIFSFHTCNEAEGGYQLDVDITGYFELENVLESYKNVCSCINVPTEYVQSMDGWAINNHHNALLAYYEPNCSENQWKAKFIAAGLNSDANEMSSYVKVDSVTETEYPIQSFGPDPKSQYFQTSCNNTQVTTEGTKIHAVTKESVEDVDIKLDQRVEDLSIEFVKQTNFQNNFLKQHLEGFSKLTEQITKLQLEFRNFTEKINCLNQIDN